MTVCGIWYNRDHSIDKLYETDTQFRVSVNIISLLNW